MAKDYTPNDRTSKRQVAYPVRDTGGASIMGGGNLKDTHATGKYGGAYAKESTRSYSDDMGKLGDTHAKGKEGGEYGKEASSKKVTGGSCPGATAYTGDVSYKMTRDNDKR